MHEKSDRQDAGKVADAIAGTLKKYGAHFAFGIPGNDVLETVRACEAQGIEFILGKSEPSCAFMADAVYQLTGAPVALIPALGPGISNAMSGIAGAMQERSAVLVLSGEMASANMGIYNHQVFDHVALARPVTKYAEQLNPMRAAQQVAKALDIALAYPAGPVLLNVPADHSRADAASEEDFQPARIGATALVPDEAARLGKMLASAKRPLLLAGRGALRVAFPVIGPVAERVAVPGGLGGERGQAEFIPDLTRTLHVLARRQGERRHRLLLRGID